MLDRGCLTKFHNGFGVLSPGTCAKESYRHASVFLEEVASTWEMVKLTVPVFSRQLPLLPSGVVVSPSLLLFVAPGVSRQLMMTAAFCILPIILARLLFFHINLHFLAFSKFFSSHFQNTASPGLRTSLPPPLPALYCGAPSCSGVAEASSPQRCRCNSSY